MFEISGEKTPLLFDRWKPLKFVDCALDENGEPYNEGIEPHFAQISKFYHFPEGYVLFEMNSEQCYIQGNFNVRGLDVKGRFTPSFLSMYIDAKEYARGIVSVLRKDLADKAVEVVDDISLFARTVHINLELGHGPGCIPLDDALARNAEISKVYQRIEAEMIRKHGPFQQHLQEAYVLIYALGEGKQLSSQEGIHLIAEQFGTGLINAGSLYMKLIGDDKATEENYGAALDSLIKAIYKESGGLMTYHGNPFNEYLNGNGTFWQVDFRRLPFYRQLSSGSISRLLQDTSMNVPYG
jgi:hypothetical protein